MLSQLGNIPYFHVSKFETTASVVTWVSGLNDIRDMPVRMGMVSTFLPQQSQLYKQLCIRGRVKDVWSRGKEEGRMSEEDVKVKGEGGEEND